MEEEMPVFRVSWRLLVALWGHDHPVLLAALSVSAFLVVWTS